MAGRYLSGHIDPLFLASVRFLIASITLIAILFISQKGFVNVTRTQAIQLVVLGLFGIYAYNLFFFYGLHYIDASRASLIVTTNPAVIALFSYVFFKERLSFKKIGAIALCMLGVVGVLSSKSSHSLFSAQQAGAGIGEVLIFGCVVSWVVYSVFCKGIVRAIGPLHTVTYSVIAGAIMLTMMAIATGKMTSAAVAALTATDMFSLSYLGMLGSAVAYVLYYDGIHRIGATRAGAFIALNPLTAVIAGALLLHEPLSLQMLVGGILIITGIFFINKPSSPPRQ